MNATATAPVSTADVFTIIPISNLHESKTNPRRHFAGIEDLTASVKQHGVLTPLLVRLCRDDSGKPQDLLGYEIIAGARRYRAAKAAGIEGVPARVMDLTDSQALEFQVIENLQREDIHPLDEALGYEALLKAGNYDVPAIALRVNKSESYVYQRLKLTSLIPEAQKACFSDKITAGHAILIARLQPKDQNEALKSTINHGLSVRELASHIESEIHLELRKAPWSVDDATLLPAAGSCVACPKRTGANPQLFPDVKAKDTCTDPGCYREKLQALVARNSSQDLVSISTSSVPYGEKKVPGILYEGEYRSAGSEKCQSLHSAVVVLAQYGNVKVGARATVCVGKNCKVHVQKSYYGSGRISGITKSASEKAKERRTRAISDARNEAVRQIAAKRKWPVNQQEFKSITLAFYERLTFESTKLACKILGVWPKDGKTGGFDFRSKLKAFLQYQDSSGVAKCAAVFSLMPEWGKWGGGYYGDGEEKARLNAAGELAGINVGKIEAQFISAANAKAASKAKARAKVHTSAKRKKA
jgi:ParB/RepB/Spo0J family partition protein